MIALCLVTSIYPLNRFSGKEKPARFRAGHVMECVAVRFATKALCYAGDLQSAHAFRAGDGDLQSTHARWMDGLRILHGCCGPPLVDELLHHLDF